MPELSSIIKPQWIFLLIGVFFIPFSLFVKDKIAPYSIQEQLGTHKNLAVSISLTGYLIGIVFILLGSYLGPSKGLKQDIINFIGYGLMGVLLLNAARFINNKLLFRKFYSVDEIVRDKNAGAGAVEFGSYIASALIVAGSIYGEGGSILSVLVFFSMGQLVLLAATIVYNLITPFDIHHEIEKDNAAAGIAFAGILAGTGVILLKGIAGNFIDWKTSLIDFGISVAISLAIFPLVRLLLDKIMLPKIDLNSSIAKDQNIAVALLEMSASISIAIIIYFMLDFSVRS
ncbi:MAG: DUF350 domain-containing protein [Spirochaetia bacterium]|nr:DUF350 domain-containing protein [Spirochaetia bacterium]